jgi:two-component system, chemotaxis family, protein-glutamate methylesterase/glutaminase
MQKKIRVLIVDDSALMREMLGSLLAQHADIELVGSAFDPFDAREKIKALAPDVITLDVEMPRMDGLSFLEKIMSLRPMPVVMVSTLTGKATDTAIAALQLGALDCLAKPHLHSEQDVQQFSENLVEKIRTASRARVHTRHATPRQQPQPGRGNPSVHAPKLIAIGASTGGVEALSELLVQLPKNMPPVVITQHMPPFFTASFARRLDAMCALAVVEAQDAMPLVPGQAVIAAGGVHLRVVRSGAQLLCRLDDGPAVSSHKPSVDVLFHSVADQVGASALGVILTGMGRDGAQGLLAMREAGAHTIGQDEASSVVYGMPRVAHDLGAVVEVHALADIAGAIKGRCFR